jgi:hypothetical protein
VEQTTQFFKIKFGYLQSSNCILFLLLIIIIVCLHKSYKEIVGAVFVCFVGIGIVITKANVLCLSALHIPAD